MLILYTSQTSKLIMVQYIKYFIINLDINILYLTFIKILDILSQY